VKRRVFLGVPGSCAAAGKGFLPGVFETRQFF
jgi:hypothetical protein